MLRGLSAVEGACECSRLRRDSASCTGACRAAPLPQRRTARRRGGDSRTTAGRATGAHSPRLTSPGQTRRITATQTAGRHRARKLTPTNECPPIAKKEKRGQRRCTGPTSTECTSRHSGDEGTQALSRLTDCRFFHSRVTTVKVSSSKARPVATQQRTIASIYRTIKYCSHTHAMADQAVHAATQLCPRSYRDTCLCLTTEARKTGVKARTRPRR